MLVTLLLTRKIIKGIPRLRRYKTNFIKNTCLLIIVQKSNYKIEIQFVNNFQSLYPIIRSN